MAAADLRPAAVRAGFALLVLATAIALAGCSSTAPSASAAAVEATSAPPSLAPAATASPTESPTEPPSASAAPSSGATAVPTAIDPCTLVTAAEASTLVGSSFGAGQASTSGDTRICAYGAATPNVFEVLVAQAPDATTAKADEQQAEAELKAQAAQLASTGFTATQLTGLAPGVDAVLLEGTVSAGGMTVGGRAIYLLKGAVFAGFSDIALNGAPPSVDAMKAQAVALIGRLP